MVKPQAVVLVVLAGCAGAGTAPAPSPPPEPPAPVRPGGAAPIKPRTRLDDVAAAKVYDEQGNASACAPPQAECPALPVSNAFLDHCRLAGFQVRQCGCEARCGGNVAALTRHYDADGRVEDCAPARDDCTPPQASAAFQDACSEHGYRLDVCGCAWLCSGDFKQ
jgi:hypothetical protein